MRTNWKVLQKQTSTLKRALKQEEIRGCRPMKATTTPLLHSICVHNTYDCRLFLQRSVKNRKAIVREKKACFNCLMIGHTATSLWDQAACPKKESGPNHHKLYQDDFLEENKDKVKCQ